jgi:hypothetical protein
MSYTNQERKIIMNRKWLLTITTIFLSTMMIMGCNFNQDRQNDQNQDNIEETNYNDAERGNDNSPGVDENDNMLKDDERDRDPDPEDPIEDPEDMGDRDRRDD